MRNMLAFLAAVVVTVAAVGWYLDWYKVGTVPSPTGHNTVTVDFDNVKIGQDIHQAETKIQNKLAERNKQSSPPEVSPATVELPVPDINPARATPR